MTNYRRIAASRYAAILGLDTDTLYTASIAVWDNLGKHRWSYGEALDAAAIALSSAKEKP